MQALGSWDTAKLDLDLRGTVWRFQVCDSPHM